MPDVEWRSSRRGFLARCGLTAAMTIVAVNVWTGGPLAALWVGSRFQGGGPPTMGAVAVVVASLAVISIVLVKLLAFLGERHASLTGRSPTVRTHAPWLRSMRGERPQYPGDRPHITALERVLVVVVVAAVLAFEIWFFFFSTSPIDGRSGRSQIDFAAS
jgi:hypothetical protein